MNLQQKSTVASRELVATDVFNAMTPPDLAPTRRSHPSSRSRFLSVTVRMAVFYGTLILFGFEDYLNIGAGRSEELITTASLFGIIRYSDIGLILIVGYCTAFDRTFRACLFSKIGRAFFGFIAIYTLLGLAFGNDRMWLRVDLSTWGWGVGGLALFHTLMRFRRPCAHILAICIFCGAILLATCWSGRSQMTIQQYVDNTRVWDQNIFRYSNILTLLVGIVLGLGVSKRIYLIGGLLAIGIDFYAGVIVGATRSVALSLIVVSICVGLGSVYKRNQHHITRRFGGAGMWIALAILAAIVIVTATMMGAAFADKTTVADRLFEDDGSALDRVEELKDALRQLGSLKFLTGGGLGYTFESIIGYTSIFLHLGTFVFLLKFGAVPFTLIVLFLYCYVPFKFLQCFVRPAALNPLSRSALLIVLPGVFGWLLTLTLSGGYDPYCSVSLGICIGTFAEIRTNGFSRLIRPARASTRVLPALSAAL